MVFNSVENHHLFMQIYLIKLSSRKINVNQTILQELDDSIIILVDFLLLLNTF